MRILFVGLIISLVSATGAFAQQGYQIRPGDVLSVEVLQDPSLNREVLVLPDGSISFPFAGKVAHLVRYTGYVGGEKRPAAAGSDGKDEVIISCGGGAVAEGLLSAALDARPLSRKAQDTTWRILIGHDVPDHAFERYRKRAPDGMRVERARRDFPDLLKRARLSVSQAGYNTVLDILIADASAVFVPFAQENETEQTQRARALERHGRAAVLEEKHLSPEQLAAAIDDALALPHRPHKVMLGGADRSADILMQDIGQCRSQSGL